MNDLTEKSHINNLYWKHRNEGRPYKYDYTQKEFKQLLKKHWTGMFTTTDIALDMTSENLFFTLKRLKISRDYCLSL